jgi:hypothetical protein
MAASPRIPASVQLMSGSQGNSPFQLTLNAGVAATS